MESTENMIRNEKECVIDKSLQALFPTLLDNGMVNFELGFNYEIGSPLKIDEPLRVSELS